MSNFALKSTADGKVLLFGSGATGRSFTPPTTSHTITIDIVERHALSAAPETIVFEADLSGAGFDDSPPNGITVVYDATLRYYYFWDFGEGYTFAAPETLSTLGWTSSQTAIGAKAAHTFRTSGNSTVSVSVWGYVSGVLTEATGELVVNIGDPNTVFSTTKTVFMSPNTADFSDAPIDAVTVESNNINTVYIDEIRGQEATPMRLMLARGRTYVSTTGLSLGKNAGEKFPTTHVVAGPGAGAKPIVNVTSDLFDIEDDQGALGDFAKDFVVQNIEFYGPWDSEDHSGDSGSKFVSVRDSASALQAVTLDGCVVDGFGFSLEMANPGNSDTNLLSVNDSVTTNYDQSSIYGYNVNVLALVGSKQTSKATAGSVATSNGGFVQRSDATLTIVNKSDCFCRTGWSSAGGGYIATQPALRLAVGGKKNSTHLVTQSTLESGFSLVQFNTQDTSTKPEPVNAIVDSCYGVSTWQGSTVFDTRYGGITIRNTIVVYPETTTDNIGPGAFLRALDVGSAPFGDAVNYSTPQEVYSCTFANQRAGTDSLGAFLTDADAKWTGNLVDENNIKHEPNLTTPNTPNDLVDSGTVYFNPREYGYRLAASGSPTAGQASPATTCYSYRPQATGDAYESATGQFAEFDMFGVRRKAGAPSKGAVEP